MTRSLCFALAVLLAGCAPSLRRGDDDEETDDDDATSPELEPGTPVGGDWSCVGATSDGESTNTGDLLVQVVDLQEGYSVPGADVELWPREDPADAVTGQTDAGGAVTFGPSDLVPCTEFGGRVSTSFTPPET